MGRSCVLVFGFDSFMDFILGGSWVVISGVISRVTIVITQVRGPITPLITTHEPPSRGLKQALDQLGWVSMERDQPPFQAVHKTSWFCLGIRCRDLALGLGCLRCTSDESNGC